MIIAPRRPGRDRVAESALVDGEPFVARDVDMHDPLERRGAHPVVDVDAEVLAVHVRVVHVEHQPAIGGLADAREKLGLAELGAARMPVVADVLDRERHADGVSRAPDPVGDPLDGGSLERDGQEIVQRPPADRADAEVVRVPRRAERRRAWPQVAQVPLVERVDAAERHRQAVRDDRVSLGEPRRGPTAGRLRGRM